MSQNNYIIYRVKNVWTGEVYIGATTNSIRQRKWDHLERAKRGEIGKFHVALARWTNAFTWTQIDTSGSTDDLAKKEKEYVIKFNSIENGYNSDAGGGIQKSVYQYNIDDGRLVNRFDCLESAANAVNVVKQSISKACSGENRTCKGFYWSYSLTESYVIQKDRRRREVVQLNQQGDPIGRYKSASEASRITGISKTSIARYCRGEREQTGGFHWKYI